MHHRRTRRRSRLGKKRAPPRECRRHHCTEPCSRRHSSTRLHRGCTLRRHSRNHSQRHSSRSSHHECSAHRHRWRCSPRDRCLRSRRVRTVRCRSPEPGQHHARLRQWLRRSRARRWTRRQTTPSLRRFAQRHCRSKCPPLPRQPSFHSQPHRPRTRVLTSRSNPAPRELGPRPSSSGRAPRGVLPPTSIDLGIWTSEHHRKHEIPASGRKRRQELGTCTIATPRRNCE